MKMCLLNKYRRLVNEKYVLQQYEGRISDAFWSDIKEINKIAPQVMCYLYRYGVFCIKRMIFQDNLTAILNIIFYDKDADASDVIHSANKFDKVPIGYGPDECNGYATNNTVVVWLPVDLVKSPFVDKKLNYMIYDNDRFDAADAMDSDNVISVENFSKIDVSPYKNKNKDAMDILFSNLDDSQTRSEKHLDIDDATTRLGTIRHELTHVLDRGNAGSVNHYSNLLSDYNTDAPDYKANKNYIEMLINILYKLWSYTEFNAFTQTYGTHSDKKRSVDMDTLIAKTASSVMGRNKDYSLDDFIATMRSDLEKLNECSDEFWKIAKDIAIKGAQTTSVVERYRGMAPLKFKKYFFDTSYKLLDKFKEKTVKNVNTRNIYTRDIAKMARVIRDECVNATINKSCKQDFVLSFNFDYYFKKYTQDSPVVVTFTTSYLPKHARQISTINSSTNVSVKAKYVDIDTTASLTRFFNGYNTVFASLYIELFDKNRKSVIEELSMNLAEDIYKALSDL